MSLPGEEDYYALLEVRPDASIEVIDKAFQVIVKRWHPDANGDNAENNRVTQRLNEAMSVLRNPVLRAQYDDAHGDSRASNAFIPDSAPDGATIRDVRDRATPLDGDLSPEPQGPRARTSAMPSWPGPRNRSRPGPRGASCGPNKWIAVVLAVLFGGYGVHLFYLRRPGRALLMLGVYLGCGIAAALVAAEVTSQVLALVSGCVYPLAFVQAIVYVFTPAERFRATYG